MSELPTSANPTPVTPAPAPAAAPALAAPAAPAAPAPITYEQCMAVDLRVATITKADIHPNADKLLVLRLDDGTPEGRQVCAGIKAWYTPESLIGRQVVVVANLQPRTIRGQISQGMVLCASDVSAAATANGAERNVVLLALSTPVPPGSKIS